MTHCLKLPAPKALYHDHSTPPNAPELISRLINFALCGAKQRETKCVFPAFLRYSIFLGFLQLLDGIKLVIFFTKLSSNHEHTK
jgi:hypothetical protein